MAEADAGGWRPIETAPRDGTYILIPGRTGRNDRIAVTIPECVSWRDCPLLGGLPDFQGGWRPIDDAQAARKPTHWMPLPEPPATPPARP